VAWTRYEYETNILPLLHPHQSVFVVPGLWGCSGSPRNARWNNSLSLEQQSDALVARLRAVMAWAKEEPRIAGINPWHYDTEPGLQCGGGCCDLGGAAFPAVVKEFQAIARTLSPPLTVSPDAAVYPHEGPSSAKTDDSIETPLSDENLTTDADILRCEARQNCSVVLQSAIDIATAAGGNGKISIGGLWPVLPIVLRSHLFFDLSADTTLIAQRGAFHGGADFLVSVYGVSNVTIRGAVGGGSRLAMHKSDYVNTSLYTHSEGRHALYIMESRHVRVSDLEIVDPGGDSVYIGGSIGGGPSTDVELLRVTTRNAYRNGLSITSARDVVVRSCRFLNTSGTPPEAGVDLEPNLPHDWMYNISFIDMESRWNHGSGLSLALGKLSCEKKKPACVPGWRHWPACSCPSDPPLVTVNVEGALIQGASQLGLNASALIQGFDFNIGILISAGTPDMSLLYHCTVTS
jgi:hypothetical protein